MSIPAVVLRDACTFLRDGEQITVDGRNGTVSRAPSAETAKVASNGRRNRREDRPSRRAHRPRAHSPPRRGAALVGENPQRLHLLLFWCVYLLAAFPLPENVLYQPSLRFLDIFLWPLVRIFGKPGAVALIAACMGAIRDVRGRST